MLKKTIKYTDFEGRELEEEFYFNMTTAELTELELSTPGGFRSYLQSVIDAQDTAAIMKTFRSLIRMTVGVKSEDGKRFIKSNEIADGFEQSGAYSEFYMEIVGNANAAVEFIKGVMPKDLQDKVAALEKSGELPQTTTGVKRADEYTRDEIMDMDQETFEKIFGTDIKKWPRPVLQAAMARQAKALGA